MEQCLESQLPVRLQHQHVTMKYIFYVSKIGLYLCLSYLVMLAQA